jgi:hypothetical protein
MSAFGLRRHVSWSRTCWLFLTASWLGKFCLKGSGDLIYFTFEPMTLDSQVNE